RFQDKGVWTLQSPVHVWNLELCGPVPIVAVDLAAHRNRHLVFGAVQQKLSMHLRRNGSRSRELAFNAVGSKYNVAVLRALQHVFVHLLVAARITGLSARSVRNDFAARFSIRLDVQAATLDRE